MDMRDVVENCNSSPLWANLRATSCLATPSLLRKVSHSRINRELAWKPVRITNAVCFCCFAIFGFALSGLPLYSYLLFCVAHELITGSGS